jgi:hypothetical protein
MHADFQNVMQGYVGEKTASDYGDTWIEAAYREIMKIPRYSFGQQVRPARAPGARYDRSTAVGYPRSMLAKENVRAPDPSRLTSKYEAAKLLRSSGSENAE